jgi:PAS domain S-box-containing protein
MVENSEDIMAICNADSSIRYVSPSSRQVLGYDHEEVVGASGFDHVHPEDRANVVAALNEFVKTPGARDSVQYRARHADGSWVSFEVVGYNMLDHPVVRGVVLTGRKVSKCERSQAERQHPITKLPGLLNICSSCKKIRDEAGKWKDLEGYFQDRAQIKFSHGLCADCAATLYPEIFKK